MFRQIQILLITLMLAGCSAWKAYDPENEDEYVKYWSDGKNVRSSILYPYTDEYRHRE